MNDLPEHYNKIKWWMNNRKHPGHNITGVHEKLHVVDALRIHKKLFPATNKVVFITDDSPTGKAIQREIIKELLSARRFPCSWEIRVALSWEDYKRIIEELDKDENVSAIYAAAVRLLSEQNGQIYSPKQVLNWTVKHFHKPEIAPNHEFVRMGLFGGASVDFYEMGKQAGRMVLKILKGVPPGDIPIEEARRYVLVFNMNRAAQLNIVIPKDILLAADEVITSSGSKR